MPTKAKEHHKAASSMEGCRTASSMLRWGGLQTFERWAFGWDDSLDTRFGFVLLFIHDLDSERPESTLQSVATHSACGVLVRFGDIAPKVSCSVIDRSPKRVNLESIYHSQYRYFSEKCFDLQ